MEGAKLKEYKSIFETYNFADMAFLKLLLRANSIDFIVENENFATIRPLSGVPMMIKVNVGQLDEAKELLKDFKGGNFRQRQV